MEKIDLPSFYRLGTQLGQLAEAKLATSTRVSIMLASLRSYRLVSSLLNQYSTLTVCRARGTELLEAIDELNKWWDETPPEKLSEPDQLADTKFSSAIDKAKRFEAVLSEELGILAAYHVTQKGIYSTSALINQAQDVLPELIRGRISQIVAEEIRQSGRCLAFDNSTASGFHIIRAIEAVMHDYYIFICKPASEKKLKSWAAYISALYKLSEDTKAEKSIRKDIKKVIALLQLIKDQDRNLIMHPEAVLTPDDAHKLFDISIGTIIAMADRLPEGKAP